MPFIFGTKEVFWHLRFVIKFNNLPKGNVFLFYQNICNLVESPVKYNFGWKYMKSSYFSKSNELLETDFVKTSENFKPKFSIGSPELSRVWVTIINSLEISETLIGILQVFEI